MTTLYYSHPDFLAHDTGLGHPECADRLHVIEQALSAPEFDALVRVSPPLTDELHDHIALIHTPAMIDFVLNSIPQQGQYGLDADTIVCPASGRAALRAVGAVCDAVEQICNHRADRAFCAVRPPGHHAEPGQAMGFCLFNNIAIAAEYARTRYRLNKIAIVDFDVHHGNGTQAAFYRQPQVLYASTHEMPHYPGTGHPSETGVDNIINVPLAPETTGAEFREKYRTIILPALENFRPQLILISAGFDGHENDPLASIRLTQDDYQWLTDELMRIACKHSQGRIISVLEGGYNLQALAGCVAAHVQTLMNSC